MRKFLIVGAGIFLLLSGCYVIPTPSPTFIDRVGVTIEAYPIVVSRDGSPEHVDFGNYIPDAVKSRREAWRNIPYRGNPISVTQALEPFGYKLKLHSMDLPGNMASYDLYWRETLMLSQAGDFSPVYVNASGNDFFVIIHGNAKILTIEGLKSWDEGTHTWAGAVFVGDDFVTVESTRMIDYYRVLRNGQEVFRTAGGCCADNPPLKGLWAWGDHWVLEVQGQVFIDGKSLNDELGYSEIFNWQLLDGKPFFFFRDNTNKVGISYDSQVLPLVYEEVFHYSCCGPGQFNVMGNDWMVWFYALQDEMWYYVEIGRYD